ncbi:MAG: penicillin-binding protein 2 [Ignavibacteriales bacterium]|nr:penicillin-binding protein 2 [Ignavibacteriales bacterium]
MMETADFGSPRRGNVMVIIVAALFAVLFLRLYQLQLFYHEELGKQSEENSIRTFVKEPIRGYVYDRNGKLMVDVGPSFTVTVIPAGFEAGNLELLSSFLQTEPQSIQDRITKGRARSRFSPVKVLRDINFTALSAIEEHLFMLPGVSYEVESKRYYPTKARASHLLGYCKEITDAQLAKAGEYYRQGDVIGSAGLEASYETFLRGEKGYEYVAVNSKGQLLGSFENGKNDKRPTEGFDLVLSIDADVQAFAESLMTNFRGSIVAIDPNDGGILAMVSKPDFDPSVFSGVTPAEVWNQLNNDLEKPLFNRATMTRYPPGSTFKMLVAAAALEEGIIDENYRITCRGAYRFGNRTYKDQKVHGSTNIVEAIQKSCNVFFYQLILKVGLDNLNRYSGKFGFGQPTGIDIGEETAGLIPSVEYYDRVYGKGKWTQGYLVSLGVGQGEIGASPLQMARYAAALANGGTLRQPHAVNLVRNKQTNRMNTIEHRSGRVGISQNNMNLIREGMRRVVQEAGGTGGMARVPNITSAGKTGTAENPHGDDHSWFVGFAPFDNPKIAVAVLLENAGFGGTRAAPIGGFVIEKYLFGDVRRRMYIAPAKKDTVVKVTQAVAQ